MRRPARHPVAVFALLLLLIGPGSLARAQDETLLSVQPARQLMAAGRYAEAEVLLAPITAAQPHHGPAWYLLGLARHQQGKLELALEAHLQASNDARVAGSALFNAACAQALLGRTDEAFAALARAREAGFSDRAQLLKDRDLASLRDDPRFAALLPSLVPSLLMGDELFVEPTRVLHTFDGEWPGGQFGWVARNMGDLDADGVDDFATTAPTFRGDAGKLYVYSSRSGELRFTREGQRGERLGNGVAGAGDVDGDGTPDIVVGAPAGGPAPGRAYVLSGRDGELLLTLSGDQAGEQFGLKVCGVGDLDGDGHADVAVGAYLRDIDGLTDAGRVSVFSGADGALLASLDGDAAGASFGSALDATRDGIQAGTQRLLVVGAMGAGDGNRGRAYVYRWTDGAYAPAFVIEADATGSHLGQYFVSILGDVDGDGVSDVYASDFGNAALGNHTGRVYVHSGADGSRLLTLTGQPGEGFGTSPSVCGDVDGDGHADLVVGAWQNAEGAPSGGKVSLHSGRDGSLLASWTCRENGDTFGFDAVGLGDVDGDGGIDFLLTSGWSAVLGPQTGRVFIVAGPVFGEDD